MSWLKKSVFDCFDTDNGKQSRRVLKENDGGRLVDERATLDAVDPLRGRRFLRRGPVADPLSV